MTERRKGYAWKDKTTGKWCLSVFPPGQTHAVRHDGRPRPFNQYDEQGELVTEAAKRQLELEWEDAG